MARKTVNATRMELLKGKKRAILAKRGHKLLKDKLDGIVQRFLGMVKEYQKLKKEFEPKLVQIFIDAIFVGSKMTPEQMEKIVQDNPATASLNVEIKNFMGVMIPQYNLKSPKSETNPRYDLIGTPAELDTLYLKMKDILPSLIRLAQMTQTIETMVHEIIEIKRRVNALEYILIPELDETNKYITMKLSEMERSNLVSLMKIKELVNKTEQPVLS